jgi:uncharacterized protein YukE
VWGYHRDYDNAYSDVETVTIDSSNTALSVTDASVYETRQYLKIEDELLQITARDANTNTLTVKRGVNGTTAVAHTSQTASAYSAMQDVQTAVERIATWLEINRTTGNNVVEFGDGSVVLDQMPTAVQKTIQKYRRIRMGAI